MLVSILIPAYNAESYLSHAIESALHQTWPHKEIIVVDDGSKDKTLQIALSYFDKGVRVFKNERNIGQTASLNRCLAEMSEDTQFVQYLDADDILSPNKIEEQINRLIKEKSGVLATCSWGRFYTHNPDDALFVEGYDWKDYSDPVAWLVDDWSGRGTMPPGAWLFPRSIVDKIGPWNEKLSLNNDMEYFTRAVIASSGIVFCRNAKLYYRSGLANNLSGRRDAKAMASQREVIRLSTEALLLRENSSRTRHAAACYWQTLAYMAYPDYPELVYEAEARASALGGGTRKPSVSRPFLPISNYVSWKLALRLTKFWYKVRYN